MRTAIYHSSEWDSLVETGWVTMYVTADGVAVLIYSPKR